MQAVAHQRRAQSLRDALEVQETSSWREFQAVASVLVAAGALEAGTYRVRFLQSQTREPNLCSTAAALLLWCSAGSVNYASK